MVTTTLEGTARALVAPGKGILAADESHATIGRRFEPLGIANTEENRRRYRQMLLTTKGIGEYISGVILFDETIRQAADDGCSFVKVLADEGMIPGIKVDRGTKPLEGLPGEQVTEGLDGLRERLAEYKQLGARFAKWRAVIAIGDDGRTPTRLALELNASALARYGALCQEAEIVPIVEPEVLIDGAHSIERCFEVTEATLHTVFHALWEHKVLLEGMLLKPSMVLPGASAPKAPVEAVAQATVRCLRRTVPSAVPGIVFLSGGQSDELATAHLTAMNRLSESAPWPLSFSFARALQAAPLAAWRGDATRVEDGQRAFRHRARCNSAARAGAYSPELERSVR
jgi:fructose-bisphosphate aldolase, class I